MNEESKAEMDDGSEMNEETEPFEIENKYSFKQPVILDMQLPSFEKEVIMGYPMLFTDRN